MRRDTPERTPVPSASFPGEAPTLRRTYTRQTEVRRFFDMNERFFVWRKKAPAAGTDAYWEPYTYRGRAYPELQNKNFTANWTNLGFVPGAVAVTTPKFGLFAEQHTVLGAAN
jgi:hypothetical protein